MPDTTTTVDTSDLARAAAPAPSRRVVDAPTRMFHWLFALSFAGAWLSAESEHWRALHVTLGYTLAGLLAWRVVYGLVGPRHARLSLLWRRVAGAPAWLRSLVGRADAGDRSAPQGAHLAMAAAIVAMLLLAGPLALSGYATYEEWGGDAFEDVHEFLANTYLALVLLHLAVLALLSAVRRRNLALPMLSGRVPGRGPDLVRHNRRALAVLLLLAVVAFGVWQHRQTPRGLLPDAATALRSIEHDDD